MESRPPVIAGNWKMNATLAEAKELVTAIVRASLSLAEAEIIVAPPFTALAEVGKVLQGSPVQMAAQNLFWEDWGAFTGEIAAPMLKDVGCQYVIIGHSERRQLFGETDEAVHKKIKAALRHQLIPIVCVGETLEERQRGETVLRVEAQLEEGLAGFTAEELASILIAYEPVWAIGTGMTASPEQAQEVHAFIREKLAARSGKERASCAIILYGGSVKPANAFTLMSEKDIDGFLVGGASLEARSFVQIIEEAIRAVKEKK